MKRLVVFLSALVILGCEPQVSIEGEKILQVEQPSNMTVYITRNETEIGEPEFQVFNKYDNTPRKNVIINIKQSDESRLLLNVAGLKAGEYRLVVSLPYHNTLMGISLFQKNITASYDFVVHESLPGNCFSFDKKEKGLDGWSIKGVYVDNRDKPIGDSTCPGLFYVNHSWPFPLNQTVEGGSLFVPVADNCFPKPGQQATQSNRWLIKFTSPDLSNNRTWQGLKRIMFRVATKNIPVQVSPEISFTSQTATPAQSEKPQYAVSGGQWVVIDHPLTLPQDAKINGISIHVSGIPEQTVGKDVDSIYIDGVCPIH